MMKGKEIIGEKLKEKTQQAQNHMKGNRREEEKRI